MALQGGRRSRRPAPEAPAEGAGATDPPADPVSAARTVCLNLLTVRARSRAELADELARRDVPDETAATVLDRLVEVGLLDDAAFAEQWIRSRHRHRGLGRRVLADELRRKGVDRSTATTALAEIGRDDERVRADELVRRRLPSLARVDTTTAARRLVGMLARKGYDAGLAHDVVRTAMADRAAELDGADDEAPGLLDAGDTGP